MEQIISRQFAISEGNAEPLPLPDYDTYAICNLRGGIGKSSLCFNLSYLTDNVLMVDTCPQGNLSYFYDNQYFSRERQKFCVHGIIGARQTGASNEHEHQTQFS